MKWAYSIVYYAICSTTAIYLIKDRDYFPWWLGGLGTCYNQFLGAPGLSQATYGMKVFYLFQLGKHASRLFSHMFIRQEGNYYEYVLHHSLSSFLILFSYPEADCPISSITMAAKRELDRLQHGYLQTDVVRRHSWQAVVFSLIVFDLVINSYELDAFLGALIDQKEHKVGELYGIEILDDQRTVIGQCLMSKHTTDALRLARKMSSVHAVADIKSGLLDMIRAINPQWPNLSTDKTTAGLQSLAAHWAMIMLPPLAQFSLVHKAPLIPMNDIHRISLQPEPVWMSGKTGSVDRP